MFDPNVFDPASVSEQTRDFTAMLAEMQPDILAVPPDAQTLRDRLAGFAAEAAGGAIYTSPRARVVSGEWKSRAVEVRVLEPAKPRGVVVFIHGGGWVVGSPDAQDARLEMLAEQGYVVVAPRYRLAPEHPYPAGLDDCEAAIGWAIDAYPELADQARIAVLGESAGANLAVAALLRLKAARRHCPIGAMVLFYGVYDLSMTPSQRAYGDPQGLLGSSLMIGFYDQYVAEGQRRDALVSPLYADLDDCPPALFTVGTRDVLLDDSLFLHARWLAQGNPAELHVLPGGVHAFNYYPLEIAAQANERVAAFLRRELRIGDEA